MVLALYGRVNEGKSALIISVHAIHTAVIYTVQYRRPFNVKEIVYLFRRVGSCETDQVVNKLGWAKTVSNEWLVVVNTNEYPQEVRTVYCK